MPWQGVSAMDLRTQFVVPRPLPRRVPPVDYPGHWGRRRVSDRGTISWKHVPLFLSEALVGEDVGLEPIDDGLWTIYFEHLPLARFVEPVRLLLPRPWQVCWP